MSTAPAALADHNRIEMTIQLSREQWRLVRQAANICNLGMAEFMLASATSNADRVLADHRWHVLAGTAVEDYQALLDAHTEGTPVHQMAGLALATGDRRS